MVKHNNQLPHNLPQLRNLIKRDPVSYKEEFLQQYDHFRSLIQLFQLQPVVYKKDLEDLVMFLAQIAQYYPNETKEFPQLLMEILKSHHMVLHPDLRMAFCRGLVILRNKDVIAPTELLSLFFTLLRCQDKNLRTFLESHLVSDIKNINSKQKNIKLNTTLQNFIFKMLSDSNSKAAKMSLGIMIRLYKKNIWNDAKTVNVIASACFSKIVKVMVAALTFFTGTDEENPKKDSDDSDSDNEVNPKEVMMANKVNKKSRKREKQLEKVKKLVKKAKKKKEKAPAFNFSALHLIHDPQGFAEKLFKRLEATNERFEVKLLILDVISRLIGLHQLVLFNFYPYLQRYLQPHQREVTKMLLYVAQASHELVPPEIMESVLKTLANNFITERNSGDVMAVGLNAVREICSRCPLAMNQDLLRDLAMYKNNKERSVMMAAKSLIHLYRTSLPSMLSKKDRGKPTEELISLKAKPFGAIDSVDHIPGAEVLAEEDGSNEVDIKSDNESDSDSDWVDIPDSGGAERKITSDGKGEVEETEEILKRKKEIAAEKSVSRILTDEDFKKIDTALIRKQFQGLKKGKKRPYEEDAEPKGELISIKDIENIHKKRKHDKEARVQSVRAGQEDRQKYGFQDKRLNPLCSKTNREKRKTKAFSMIKHKVRGKVKRSFRDKQIALRNHLLKQKKMR